MEILNPLTSASNAQTAFTIQLGKQVTLHAKGLVACDRVYIEILELSKAPDFTGNPCCTFYRTDIQVLKRTPLLCPDGRPAVLTSDFPVGTLDAPQNIALGVRVEAEEDALISVELYETESTGCMACICDRPMYCPSIKLSCDGTVAGYGFHVDDPKDPCATVPMHPCPDDTENDTVWIYPTRGKGHATKITDCDGNLIGYAADKSNCA